MNVRMLRIMMPNVHNEGRAACGASLSIVGLEGNSQKPCCVNH